MPEPNIILCTCDQLRTMKIGCTCSSELLPSPRFCLVSTLDLSLNAVSRSAGIRHNKKIVRPQQIKTAAVTSL